MFRWICTQKEQKTPDYLKLNPYGKVPVLTDDDTVLYESLHHQRIPGGKISGDRRSCPRSPAKKAKARILIDYGMAHFDSPYQKLRMELMKDAKEQNQQVIDGAKADLKKLLQRFEYELGDQQYLIGDFSLVDADLLPRFTRLEGFGVLPDPSLPRLGKYMERMKARPSVKARALKPKVYPRSRPPHGVAEKRVFRDPLFGAPSPVPSTFSTNLPCRRTAANSLLRDCKQTVERRFDRFAIPACPAANEHDLFFAQGFLHAQERLWQMEMSRRFLSGRMAEIFGDFPLPWQELSSPVSRPQDQPISIFSCGCSAFVSRAHSSLALLSDR